MAARSPDTIEFQLTQRYWEGANFVLTLEYFQLEDLALAAERFENAEHLRSYKTRKISRNPCMPI